MNMISEWFNQLDPTIKPYWVIALITSLIFIIQTIMTFIGIGDVDGGGDFDIGGDADIDVDVNTDGNTLDVGGALQLFSVRNLIGFLLGLGWGGVCFSSSISNPYLLGLCAFLTGCAFMFIFAIMFKQLRRLEHDGAFKVEDCIGQVADVYLRIPAERKGSGKIQYSFQGSVQELPAVTSGEQIPSGAKVRVVEIIGDHTLLVEKV